MPEYRDALYLRSLGMPRRIEWFAVKDRMEMHTIEVNISITKDKPFYFRDVQHFR